MSEGIKQCPGCGDKRIYASIFGAGVECPTLGCKNYSEKQAEEVFGSLEVTDDSTEDYFYLPATWDLLYKGMLLQWNSFYKDNQRGYVVDVRGDVQLLDKPEVTPIDIPEYYNIVCRKVLGCELLREGDVVVGNMVGDKGIEYPEPCVVEGPMQDYTPSTYLVAVIHEVA